MQNDDPKPLKEDPKPLKEDKAPKPDPIPGRRIDEAGEIPPPPPEPPESPSE